jgi:uncharacterized ubiquitin-like protein YukD
MPSVRVRGWFIDPTQSHWEQRELPDDVPVGRLISALLSALQLPATDASGRPIPYRLHDVKSGKQLDDSQTLSSAGVQQGDELQIFVLDAERVVLGLMLVERDAIARVVDLLESKDFHQESHRALYEAIISLFNEGAPVDVVTLAERLRGRGQLEQVGGQAYLASLLDAAPTLGNVERYARIVRWKASLRNLIAAAHEVTGLAYEDIDEVEVTTGGGVPASTPAGAMTEALPPLASGEISLGLASTLRALRALSAARTRERPPIAYVAGLSVSVGLFAASLTIFFVWRFMGVEFVFRPATTFMLAACALGWALTCLAGILRRSE